MRYVITMLLTLAGYGGYAQVADAEALKAGDKMYYAAGADTAMLKGTISAQRSAEGVGIGKILNRIPDKRKEIVLETYTKDKESLNLKQDIKLYLTQRGYTNIKTNVHPFYGKDFKYRQCDVAIMDEAGSFIIFIPPCAKAYSK